MKNPRFYGLASFFISKNYFLLKEYKKTIDYAKVALIQSSLNEKYQFFIYLILGISYYYQNLYKNSKYFLEKAYFLNSNSIKVNYFLSLNYYRQKNIKRAIYYLEEVIRIDPYFYKAYLKLSLIYCYLQNYVLAFDKIKMAYKMNKKNFFILYTIGKIFYQYKKWEKAQSFFEYSQEYISVFLKNRDLIKKYNSNINSYIGECYFLLKKYSLSLNYLIKSINFYSCYRNNFFLAKSYFFLKEYQKAEIYFRKSLIFSSKNFKIYIFLAKILKNKKNYKEALFLCKKVINIDKQNAYVKYFIARIYYIMKKNTIAIKYLEKNIKDFPSHIKSYILLAEILFKKKRIHESWEYFKQASQLDFSSILLYKKWGISLSHQKHYEKAIEKYQFILNLEPKNTKIQLRLYYCLIQLSRYSEIQFNLKNLINENPTNSVALFLYGKIYYHKGNYLKGIYYFQQAIKFKYGKLEEKILPFIAKSYFRAKNYSQSVQIYSRIIQKGFKKENYYIFFALSLFHTHNYLESIENFKNYLYTIERKKKTNLLFKKMNLSYFYLSLAYKNLFEWEKSFYFLMKTINYEIENKSISSINLNNLKVVLNNVQLDYEKRYSKESMENQKNILEYIEIIHQEFVDQLKNRIKEFEIKLKKILSITNENKSIHQLDQLYLYIKESFRQYSFKISKLKTSFEGENSSKNTIIPLTIDNTFSFKKIFNEKVKKILSKDDFFNDIVWKEEYNTNYIVKENYHYLNKVIHNFLKILKELLRNSAYSKKIIQIKVKENLNKNYIMIEIKHYGRKFITH